MFGFSVRGEGYSSEEIDAQAAWVAVTFAKLFEIDAMVVGRSIMAEGLTIELVPENFLCPQQNPEDREMKRVCSGVYYPHRKLIRVAVINECVAVSSLAHELAHAVLQITFASADHNHSLQSVWGPRGVVQLANLGECFDDCPDICSATPPGTPRVHSAQK